MRDPKFVKAYARGVEAIGGTDIYAWHWRVHIGLWAAQTASRLEGAFVECGVNFGFLSSAIMEYLDWNSLHRDFFLLDTFAGCDERFVSEEDRAAGVLQHNDENLRGGFYAQGVDIVRANFAQCPRARIVQGSIPETLERVTPDKVAYLHLDMNCSPPEVAALRHFWDRLVPGAMILLDDYAFFGFGPQKRAMDDFAREHGVAICAFPTGQGLIIKPPEPG